MKDFFKHCAVATASGSGEDCGIDRMKQWIQKFRSVRSIAAGFQVTHLICSTGKIVKHVHIEGAAIFCLPQDISFQIGAVAIRPYPRVKIVSYDRLEDTLIRGSPLKERRHLVSPETE